jgi:hypothetical protein
MKNKHLSIFKTSSKSGRFKVDLRVVTPRNLVAGTIFSEENPASIFNNVDGGSMHRNVGIHIQDYTVSNHEDHNLILFYITLFLRVPGYTRQYHF